jgi:hypothetical protein
MARTSSTAAGRGSACSVKPRQQVLKPHNPPARKRLFTVPARKRPKTEQELTAEREGRPLSVEEQRASNKAAREWWKKSDDAFQQDRDEFLLSCRKKPNKQSAMTAVRKLCCYRNVE